MYSYGLKFLLLAVVLGQLTTTVLTEEDPPDVRTYDFKFNPRAYDTGGDGTLMRVAKCSAVNRAVGEEREIDIHYVDVQPPKKDARTLVMVHGWPSLWSSWGNQIEEFKNEYHILAPNLRGFGASTHPDDVESSGTMGDHVGDLLCVLERAGVLGEGKKAICLGHDWGAQICWEAARMRPDVFEGVVAAVIPYLHSSGPSFIPTSEFVPAYPRLTYQLFFERSTADAIKELDKDVRRTLRATLRDIATPPPERFLTSETSFLAGWEEVERIPPIRFMSSNEEDYLVEQYEIQGFRNTLQFYTLGNRRGSWEFGSNQANHTIPQPALLILPSDDPVADWSQVSDLLHCGEFIPNLTTEVHTPIQRRNFQLIFLQTIDAAHWPQLEAPVEFNEIVRRWLEKVFEKNLETEDGDDTGGKSRNDNVRPAILVQSDDETEEDGWGPYRDEL